MSEFLIIALAVGTYAVVWLFFAYIYMLPSVFAFRRKHPNRWLILAVNVFLGGTGIGWGFALVWALQIIHLPGDDKGSKGGESGLNLFINDTRATRVEPPSLTSSDREQATPKAAATSNDDNVVRQIAKLRQLRDDGHITEAEFEQLKASIFRNF